MVQPGVTFGQSLTYVRLEDVGGMGGMGRTRRVCACVGARGAGGHPQAMQL